jgi:UDP-N-acetylglucosamine--N-acetylmuramyl-(pentapeptide) pyrophosphoryl-undecaprenol N-acetylglucosamine transferase
MERAGAAVLVPDAQADGARIDAVARELLLDADRLTAMSDAARGLARPDAADRLADLVEGAARGRA